MQSLAGGKHVAYWQTCVCVCVCAAAVWYQEFLCRCELESSIFIASQWSLHNLSGTLTRLRLSQQCHAADSWLSESVGEWKSVMCVICTFFLSRSHCIYIKYQCIFYIWWLNLTYKIMTTYHKENLSFESWVTQWLIAAENYIMTTKYAQYMNNAHAAPRSYIYRRRNEVRGIEWFQST